MKKALFLLVAMVFAVSSPVFAEGIALTDSEMDEIAAGEWVVLSGGEQGTDTVEEVHFNNNDITLTETAQTDISAMSNANSVDSAVAIQQNVANVSMGDAPIDATVDQLNDATVANYNPSDESSLSVAIAGDKSFAAGATHKAGIVASETLLAGAAGSAYYSESDVIDEDFTAAAAGSYSDSHVGKGDIGSASGSFAAGAVYTYDETYSKEKGASFGSFVDAKKSLAASEEDAAFVAGSESASVDVATYSRSNKSENNHITLINDSQKNLSVMTNLNTVGSGVAVQQNIATDMGVAGAITQTNISNVSNGM